MMDLNLALQPQQGFEAGKRQKIAPTDPDGFNRSSEEQELADFIGDEKMAAVATLSGSIQMDGINNSGSLQEHPNSAMSSDMDEIDDIEMSAAECTSSDALPHPAYDLTESMIAQKMSSLSMQEREEVYYDIHGVNSPIDEQAESGFLDRNLEAMENELQRISGGERQAYDMAHDADPSYVKDRDFRLRFLRAERFNARLAAIRYVRHYQFKLELFGPEKLSRDIVQDDMDDEDLEALYCGLAQLLPRRDSAGRLVFVWISGSTHQALSNKSVFRRLFYNTMMASEDVETQRKGSVVIAYSLNRAQTRRGSAGSNMLQYLTGTLRSIPMMVVSLHCCYDNYAWVPVLSIIKFSSHLFLQLRFQSHFGSHKDCVFKLHTFGIPAETLPIDENGEVRSDDHRRFLQRRRLQEREQAQKAKNADATTVTDKLSKILVPTSADVLLGRGSGYFNHAGNIRYRSLVEDRKELYDRSSKKDKQKIAEEITDIIHGYGGRFLRGDDGEWIPIDNKSKLKKIAHSFRALRSSSINNNANGAVAPASKRISRD